MTEETIDVLAVLEKARQGDQDAACVLVGHLYPTVIKVVRAHRPQRMAETDLAQEVFLKLFTRLDQFQPRAGIPLEHWVSRLAFTTCMDALRGEKRRPEIRWSDLSEGETQWLEYLVAGTEAPAPAETGAAELVQALLGRLPPEDRLLLQWLDLEEKSVNEIARLTGWSRSGVKVRAFRARHKLRRLAAQFKKDYPHERF
jgi:RNA polymerase sigma-70 factor (ECF subfamily)